jgi:hypothetical protein
MIFIFPARTIPFTEKAAKALNVKATKVLCNHGNRLRHSKTVGAFISGKHGGLRLRPDIRPCKGQLALRKPTMPQTAGCLGGSWGRQRDVHRKSTKLHLPLHLQRFG